MYSAKLGWAPRSSPGKYLGEFRESERKRSKLLEHDAGDLRRDGGASNAILTTWQISFDYIQSERRSAADLLSLMSFFDRQGIPAWVVKPSQAAKDEIQARGLEEAGEGDSDDSSNDDLETFKQQCIERVAALFPTGEYENWVTCRSRFAHIQLVLSYRPSKETVETWATLIYNRGWYIYISILSRVLLDRGQWEEAEKLQLGAEHPDTLATINNLVMEILKTKLGADHLDTLTSMNNLALIYLDQGRWEEAEKLFLGADHPSTLTSMANLASTLSNQGRWEEAEKLEVQHPDTPTSIASLASTYRNQGRWRRLRSCSCM
ncbi:hypothetical protein C8A01DRAFT_49431 [Parachaetomium inaequale]|uniref:Kinesin light chain n=1 Tax=Parachaetomium inaequale TaxID=2588326 RepID=A0AAN6SNV7_9PEZI|nr:hypothetical protein C8A01DRAFT_49431 [Parachaetomium inaequale]